jgi:hypothetical protein
MIYKNNYYILKKAVHVTQNIDDICLSMEGLGLLTRFSLSFFPSVF